MWLGASVFADFAVTRNFATVDRFLTSPGSSGIANEIERIGPDRLRPILRRNAGEENNTIFEDWESAEFGIAAVLIGSLFLGGRPTPSVLSLVGIMLAIVAVQRFYLSPQVTDLGRQIADLSPKDPLNQRFWTFHGIYSGVEMAKLLLGIATAVYLSIRRKKETEPAASKEAQLVVNMNG
jgi:hypothetical protein